MNELLTAELVGEMVAALALLTGGRSYNDFCDVWSVQVQMPDQRMIEVQLMEEGRCLVIASTPAGFQEWIEEWDEEGLELMRAALVRGAAFLLAGAPVAASAACSYVVDSEQTGGGDGRRYFCTITRNGALAETSEFDSQDAAEAWGKSRCAA